MSSYTLHTLELLATIAGILNIYLAARASLWNWLFGIINVSVHFIIFLSVKLYADMGLQIVFFIMQFYGIYQWLYGGDNHSQLPIRRANSKTYLTTLIATLTMFATISFILKQFTDSTTIYTDAFITAASLSAQWMMSKKWLEHWWLWMLIDVISVELYFRKHLFFLPGLYTAYFFICILGYITWRRQLVDITLTSDEKLLAEKKIN